MNTKSEYLKYIRTSLKSLKVPVKASYDTGHGLHLTTEHLGDEPMTVEVLNYSVIKIRPPDIRDFDMWYDAWKSGKRLVNKFIKRGV